MGQSDVELNNNNQTMGTTQNTSTDNSKVEFIYKVKRKKPKFKPGSELSEKVNKANIIVDIEEINELGEKEINVILEIIDNGEVMSVINDKRKVRFKAGADLTEKVNIFFKGTLMEMMPQKKKIKFKAGSELSDKVNVFNDGTEIEAIVEAKKVRFKAGADLTDKVNIVFVDIDETALEEDLLIIHINLGE